MMLASQVSLRGQIYSRDRLGLSYWALLANSREPLNPDGHGDLRTWSFQGAAIQGLPVV
jgi:hypothetical protein